jgi:Flp pilus assembly protein TadG
MMRRLSRLAGDKQASVAVEMALVVPLLLTLMFGGLEGAYYLWNEHIAIKAVRDGARYASRQPFTEFDCTTDTVAAGTVTKIDSITRTGTFGATSTTPVRVPGWDSTETFVTMSCDPATNVGLYRELSDGAPIVTVAADVPYQSLFRSLGFVTGGLRIRAVAQAAVMGI